MARSQTSAVSHPARRTSSRAKHPPILLGVKAYADKELSGLRPGIQYGQPAKKQSAKDDMLGRDMRGEGCIAPDPVHATLWNFLASHRWTYKKGTGLVDWVYYAPGYSPENGVEGETKFSGTEFAAEKLKEAGGDPKKMGLRAEDADAAAPREANEASEEVLV